MSNEESLDELKKEDNEQHEEIEMKESPSVTEEEKEIEPNMDETPSVTINIENVDAVDLEHTPSLKQQESTIIEHIPRSQRKITTLTLTVLMLVLLIFGLVFIVYAWDTVGYRGVTKATNRVCKEIVNHLDFLFEIDLHKTQTVNNLLNDYYYSPDFNLQQSVASPYVSDTSVYSVLKTISINSVIFAFETGQVFGGYRDNDDDEIYLSQLSGNTMEFYSTDSNTKARNISNHVSSMDYVYDIFNTEWYLNGKNAPDTGKIQHIFSEPIIIPTDGTLGIVLTTPLYNGGVFAGSIGAFISFAGFNKTYDLIKPTEHFKTAIITESGVLLSLNEEWIYNTIPIPSRTYQTGDDQEMFNIMKYLYNNVSSIQNNLEGQKFEDYYIVYNNFTVNNAKMVSLIAIPITDFLNEVYSSRIIGIVIAVIGVSSSLFLSFFVYKYAELIESGKSANLSNKRTKKEWYYTRLTSLSMVLVFICYFVIYLTFFTYTRNRVTLLNEAVTIEATSRIQSLSSYYTIPSVNALKFISENIIRKPWASELWSITSAVPWDYYFGTIFNSFDIVFKESTLTTFASIGIALSNNKLYSSQYSSDGVILSMNDFGNTTNPYYFSYDSSEYNFDRTQGTIAAIHTYSPTDEGWYTKVEECVTTYSANYSNPVELGDYCTMWSEVHSLTYLEDIKNDGTIGVTLSRPFFYPPNSNTLEGVIFAHLELESLSVLLEYSTHKLSTEAVSFIIEKDLGYIVATSTKESSEIDIYENKTYHFPLKCLDILSDENEEIFKTCEHMDRRIGFENIEGTVFLQRTFEEPLTGFSTIANGPEWITSTMLPRESFVKNVEDDFTLLGIFVVGTIILLFFLCFSSFSRVFKHIVPRAIPPPSYSSQIMKVYNILDPILQQVHQNKFYEKNDKEWKLNRAWKYLNFKSGNVLTLCDLEDGRFKLWVYIYEKIFCKKWYFSFVIIVCIAHQFLALFIPSSWSELQADGVSTTVALIELVFLGIETADVVFNFFMVTVWGKYDRQGQSAGQYFVHTYFPLIVQCVVIGWVGLNYYTLILFRYTTEIYIPVRPLILITKHPEIRRLLQYFIRAVLSSFKVFGLYMFVCLTGACLGLVLLNGVIHDEVMSFDNFIRSFLLVFVFVTSRRNYEHLVPHAMHKNGWFFWYFMILAIIAQFFVMVMLISMFHEMFTAVREESATRRLAAERRGVFSSFILLQDEKSKPKKLYPTISAETVKKLYKKSEIFSKHSNEVVDHVSKDGRITLDDFLHMEEQHYENVKRSGQYIKYTDFQKWMVRFYDGSLRIFVQFLLFFNFMVFTFYGSWSEGSQFTKSNLEKTLDWVIFIFFIFHIVHLSLNLIAFGKRYLNIPDQDRLFAHRFDLSLMFIAVFFFILTFIMSMVSGDKGFAKLFAGESFGYDTYCLRFIMGLPLLRVFVIVRSLRDMVRALTGLTSSLFYVFVIIASVLWFYATVGIALFKGKTVELLGHEEYKFELMTDTLPLLFQIFLGEGMFLVMYDVILVTNWVASLFFISLKFILTLFTHLLIGSILGGVRKILEEEELERKNYEKRKVLKYKLQSVDRQKIFDDEEKERIISRLTVSRNRSNTSHNPIEEHHHIE